MKAVANDDENETDTETTTETPFDRDAERAKLLASARDFVEKNGYQAVVYDQSDGADMPIWEGSRVHPEEHQAIVTANKWIGAYLAQQEKMHTLRTRRRKVLGPKLAKVMAEFDDLDAEHKAIGKLKKGKQDEVRAIVKEAESPEVRIDFTEGLGTFVLEVIEGGKTKRIDDRQQKLALGDEVDDDDPGSANGASVEYDGDGDGCGEPVRADGEDRPGLDPASVMWPDDDGDGGGNDGGGE